MNDRQKIFVRSTKVTFSACDANQASTALVPIMVTRIVIGKTLLDDFLNADLLVTPSITGIALDKQVSRETATVEIELGYDAITSLAIETQNNTLREFAHYTPSDLEKMTGEALLEAGKNLDTKIADLTVLALKDHGYLATDYTDLHDALTQFEADLNTPEFAIKTHGTEVITRDDKYKKLVDFMKNQLDSAAKPLKKKDSVFYTLYKKCRKLHLQGHRKRKKGDTGGASGEYDKVIPMLKIVPMDFQVANGKIYLFSNLGNADLKYWAQATPDVPTTIPSTAKVLTSGDEATQSYADLGYPDKVYLFVANESNAEGGEIAIDEVV